MALKRFIVIVLLSVIIHARNAPEGAAPRSLCDISLPYFPRQISIYQKKYGRKGRIDELILLSEMFFARFSRCPGHSWLLVDLDLTQRL
ncbi:MAG: hypothetical protein IJK59_05515 [Firmicutes bacterium]|nr:hypothetical protein [Bacillota bacterium]